jgi:uncharacterized protein YlxW (UPF0749 family)
MNAEALKAEKALRVTIEQERDALKAERDSLQLRVEALERELAQVQAMNQASLNALRDELAGLKTKLENGIDDV